MIEKVVNYENISLDVYKVFIDDTRKRIDDNIDRTTQATTKSERLGILAITAIGYLLNTTATINNVLLYIPVLTLIISLVPAIYMILSYKGFAKGGDSSLFLTPAKVDQVHQDYVNPKICAEYLGYYEIIIEKSNEVARDRIKYLNCQIILALVSCALYFILSQV